ncbi:MAG TPA: PAS domain S-box protein, partial [Desulfobacterales bacterium]|nr:PAS domain S-box protein [Desulfobacterales bacterium]
MTEAHDNPSLTQHLALVNTSMDGYLRVDADGRLLETNDAYCLMTGYSREELMTLSVRDLEDAETEEQTARHLAAIRERGADRFESRHRARDGRLFDVEVRVSR